MWAMCMKQAVYQDLFLTMGHQLQKLDYYSAAYHNHFADFYDRNKTHTKLGYDRFLARYGGLEGITPVWAGKRSGNDRYFRAPVH